MSKCTLKRTSQPPVTQKQPYLTPISCGLCVYMWLIGNPMVNHIKTHVRGSNLCLRPNAKSVFMRQVHDIMFKIIDIKQPQNSSYTRRFYFCECIYNA